MASAGFSMAAAAMPTSVMDRDQLWQAAQAQLINRLNSGNRIRMIQDDFRNF
ncbi:hypothetical protein [Collimonas arenae]|nr:hypothetical protein [Collimonas arenae]